MLADASWNLGSRGKREAGLDLLKYDEAVAQ